jgi:hypothetical protein
VICRKKECSIRGEEEEHRRAGRKERERAGGGEREGGRGKSGWKKGRGVWGKMGCGTYQTPAAEFVLG